MPTEEELALNLQRGDLSALSILVEQHHSQLLGFLYRMTGGDRTLAEDLVQESFLRVIRSIAHYQYPRPFKPWLYAIATNIARDHYKRADSRHTIDMPDDSEQMTPEHIDLPEDALLSQDEEDRVAAAITELPHHQHVAVILRYYQELSLAEIADTLNVPVGTVKSRLSLGLRRLKILLETEYS